jgi:hypothetical protein
MFKVARELFISFMPLLKPAFLGRSTNSKSSHLLHLRFGASSSSQICICYVDNKYSGEYSFVRNTISARSGGNLSTADAAAAMQKEL